MAGSAARFSPTRCDLCGDEASTLLLDPGTHRAMLSDCRTVEAELRKVACDTCGLVRSGSDAFDDDPEGFYRDDYRASARPEHTFHTAAGELARSGAIADWIFGHMRAGRALEVGCGAGLLIEELVRRRRRASIVGEIDGVELGAAGAESARARGLRVHEASLSTLPAGGFDLVYAIAVLEHVASPTAFLNDVHHLLAPGGEALLVQPTQDVDNYDVFLLDHLHHFGSPHLTAYAEKCGFREVARELGEAPLDRFSLHRWERREGSAPLSDTPAWTGPPAATRSARAARSILADMAALDGLLERLTAAGRTIGVFGLHEVYWLARSYSSLANAPVACGMVDEPDRTEYATLGFPVVTPEDCVRFGVDDVILAINVSYYDQVRRRLEPLGVRTHPVLR